MVSKTSTKQRCISDGLPRTAKARCCRWSRTSSGLWEEGSNPKDRSDARAGELKSFWPYTVEVYLSKVEVLSSPVIVEESLVWVRAETKVFNAQAVSGSKHGVCSFALLARLHTYAGSMYHPPVRFRPR